MEKAILNWSGGKDSAFCFYKTIILKKFEVTCLLTTISEKYERVSMHGVRTSLLEKQSESIGIPLKKIFLPEISSMQVYDNAIEKSLMDFKKQEIDHCIFGDIFLEDIRAYRIEQLQKVGFEAEFPLWGMDTKKLVKEFINIGFKAIVVCVDERYLDPSFAGRMIDNDFLNDLPVNVDPCGENGEFHSFVFDGPLYKFPVDFKIGEKVYRKYKSPSNDAEIKEDDTGFWYCDLIEK